MSEEILQAVRESQIRMEAKVDTALSSLKRLNKTVLGETGANGLAGDVRELKAAEKRHQARWKRIWGAFVAMAAAVVGSHFT